MQWAKKQTGFTIVELLIVVVVIAILASITIVSYNGISTRAKESAAQSAISQVLKKVSVHAISNGDTFPDTLAEAGITNGGSVAYQYSANNTSTPKGFCVTATVQGLSYHSAQSYTYTATTTQTLNRPAPTVGACPGHSSGGAEVVTNFVKNPNFENNTTNGWLTRSSGTISIVSNEKRTGNYSMRVVTPGNGLDDGASMNPSATSNPLSGLFASGVGGDHRGSAWVKAPAGSMLRFNVEEYTAAAVYVGGSNTSAFTATGNWQRVSQVKSIAAGNKLRVIFSTANIQPITFYVDDVMVTAGSGDYAYADGSSPGWVWSGGQNWSSSMGPAL